MRLLLLGVLSLGCARVPPASKAVTTYPLDNVPQELSPVVTHATEAMAELQQALVPRLMVALEQGDVASAVEVCRSVAQPVTKQTASSLNIEMGRTSFRLRNPANAPRDWAQPFVWAAQGKKMAEVEGLVVDLGKSVGVLKPIPTGKVCVSCHGPRESLAPEVVTAISKAYPDDAAKGFLEGDVRGFFWAEVPVPSRAP